MIFKHEVGWPLRRFFIYFGPLSNFPRYHRAGPQLCLSIPSKQYPHHGAYEWNYLCIWLPFDQINPNWLKVKLSKCKLWSPLGICPSTKIPKSYTWVTYGLHIFGMNFYLKMWHISMISLSWEMLKLLWALCLHV